MRRSGTTFLIWVIVALAVIVWVTHLMFSASRMPAPGKTSSWSYRLITSSAQLRHVVEALAHWRSLSDENAALKEQLAESRGSQAIIEQLTRENKQLRTASGISAQVRGDAIPAGLFNINLAPDGYSALINKGSREGIAVGDIVITEHHVLIGIVETVFGSSSRLKLVSDGSFKVTALIQESGVKGIAQGAFAGEMILNLVAQSDTVNEGNNVVSSGDDMVPGGLIIGTVKTIGDNNGQLFKKITILPTASYVAGSVFVIHQ